MTGLMLFLVDAVLAFGWVVLIAASVWWVMLKADGR